MAPSSDAHHDRLSEDDLDALIDLALAGTVSDEQTLTLQRAGISSDALSAARAGLAPKAGAACDVDALIAAVRARALGAEEQAVPASSTLRSSKHANAKPARVWSRAHGMRWGVGLAACLAIVWVVQTSTRNNALLGHEAAHRYTTRVGQRAAVTLSDGTRLVLAPQTTLMVPGGFGQETRTVSLSGEAFVTVQTAAGTPFVVRTGAVATRVLGTAFAIRHYGPRDPVEVAVQSGRVMVAAHRIAAVVSAGSAVRVTDSMTTPLPAGAVKQYTEWTNGYLVFENTPVPTVLATLERWYGYTFKLADSALVTRSVSTVFKISDPTEMMAGLRSLLDVTMTFNRNVVTLTHRSDARRPVRQDDTHPFTEVGR